MSSKTSVKGKPLITDKPTKALFMFAVPMILTSILQQLFNIADSVIAGKMLGDVALTAIGVSSSVIFLYIAVSAGFSIGCGVVISQYFGGKQISHMKTAIYTAFISGIVLGAVLTVIGSVFIEQLLGIMNATGEVYQDAKDFFRVYQYSLVFMFIYNVCATVFISLGDSIMPLFFLSVSIVLNILINIFFVVRMGYGVQGIAWTTFCCQAVSVALSCTFLNRKLNNLCGNVKAKAFNYKTLKVMLRIALPSILQQAVVSLGMLMVQRLVNTFPINVTTGYYAAIKIDGMAVVPIVSISNAVSTFTAQNIGAKKFERLPKGYKAGLMLDFSLGILLFILVITAAPVLVGFFIKDNPEAVKIGATYLYTVGGFYIFMAVMNTTNGVIRGFGAMKYFVAITLINLFVRVILAYTLTPSMGYKGIWWSMPISWVVACAVSLLIYKFGKWRDTRLV
jgi:putative MATE family efflux protein